MSDNSTPAAGGGIGFFGLLTILFIGLKLTGYVNWSWLWVLSPLWIPAAIVFGIIGFCLLFAGLCFAIAMFLESK